MNKILIIGISALFLIPFKGTSQENSGVNESPNKEKWYKEGWVLQAGIGMRNFGRRSENIDKVPGLSTYGSVGYMFDDIWGIRGRADYYNHIISPGYGDNEQSTAHSVALSLMGSADLIPLITGGSSSPWHLNAYLGAGLTTSWNPDMQETREAQNPDYEWNDPLFKGHDDMGHIIFGITPQYQFNSSWAISLDFSTFTMLSQDFTYDYKTRITDDGVGFNSTLSIGVVFNPHF